MTGHAFLAVDLTDEERHALSASLADANPGRSMPGKRTRPQNWHVTLRFLGPCSDFQAETLLHELDEAIEKSAGAVSATGLGAFPRPSRAGVVYSRIRDESLLLDMLAGRCEDAAREIGFAADERPFVPHITLSRLRPAQDLRKEIESFAPFSVRIAVEYVTLFRTRHSRDGISYESMGQIDLAAAR
ncbi:MAG: RNA 2',3'-cyclic phosphodiesterase [Actinomycetia bacterium]|nr:RNA 2',3'-cyclic phosphodiesterase [Actinomycetes bacterium]